ncbi:MAG TPA: tellurite resistance/C4-dicarboxylate transporter family protein [Ktedonobacterales bacterium]|nr:tellurite resistance/C4-dicarboxylate transporter family protein [Ktedonobacterales bacterium]
MRAIGHAWLEWVRTLYPGYFASVMATGIVSVALLLTGALPLSYALWGIGGALLIYLTVVYGLRALRYKAEMRRDFFDPSTAFGFFTFIAAVGVIATRFALADWMVVPGVLTIIAAIAWFILTYWIFAMVLITNEQPIGQALNGSWLIAIVATESLAIIWVLLTNIQPAQRATLQLLAYAFWTFGVLLYLIFITLIMYRFFFLKIQPSDLKPPYWINMGAMAITTVAGVRMLDVAQPTTLLVTLRPYIEGFTVMMWAWGTWWIPLLVIIGVWKYVFVREPIRYHPSLWSVVFPLGMYATAVQLLTHIPGLEFLADIGPYCTWIAFAVWALVALGWLWSALMTIRAAPRAAGALASGASPSLAASQGQPSGEQQRGSPSRIP